MQNRVSTKGRKLPHINQAMKKTTAQNSAYLTSDAADPISSGISIIELNETSNIFNWGNLQIINRQQWKIQRHIFKLKTVKQAKLNRYKNSLSYSCGKLRETVVAEIQHSEKRQIFQIFLQPSNAIVSKNKLLKLHSL